MLEELLSQGVIGLLAGLLGGLFGVGGSIIILPGLIIYFNYFHGGYSGQLQHQLQATAMICNFFIALPAAITHYRAKAVVKPVAGRMILSALAGIIMGVSLSNSRFFAHNRGVYLTYILGGFLVYVAGYNIYHLFSRKKEEPSSYPTAAGPMGGKVLLVGGAMGLIAGLLGIGGGVVGVPGQQFLLRMPLRRAIANSAITIVFVALAGAIYKNATLGVHQAAAEDAIRLAAMLIPTAIVGSFIGARLTHVFPAKVLQIVFILFIAVMAYKTLTITKTNKANDINTAEPKTSYLLRRKREYNSSFFKSQEAPTKSRLLIVTTAKTWRLLR